MHLRGPPLLRRDSEGNEERKEVEEKGNIGMWGNDTC